MPYWEVVVALLVVIISLLSYIVRLIICRDPQDVQSAVLLPTEEDSAESMNSQLHHVDTSHTVHYSCVFNDHNRANTTQQTRHSISNFTSFNSSKSIKSSSFVSSVSSKSNVSSSSELYVGALLLTGSTFTFYPSLLAQNLTEDVYFLM